MFIILFFIFQRAVRLLLSMTVSSLRRQQQCNTTSGRCLRASSASSVYEETAQRPSPGVVLFKSAERVSQRKQSVSLTEWLLRRTSKQPLNSSLNHVMTWWVCSVDFDTSESLNCIIWSFGKVLCSNVCFVPILWFLRKLWMSILDCAVEEHRLPASRSLCEGQNALSSATHRPPNISEAMKYKHVSVGTPTN